jgi:hypothetical protein
MLLLRNNMTDIEGNWRESFPQWGLGRSPKNQTDPPPYTHPVGFGKPATLHAPFPGPEGNRSYISFNLYPVFFVKILTIGAMPFFL